MKFTHVRFDLADYRRRGGLNCTLFWPSDDWQWEIVVTTATGHPKNWRRVWLRELSGYHTPGVNLVTHNMLGPALGKCVAVILSRLAGTNERRAAKDAMRALAQYGRSMDNNQYFIDDAALKEIIKNEVRSATAG